MSTSDGEQPKGLESRRWYRLLRVMLLPLYGLVVVVVLSVIYGDYHPRIVADERASLIVCDNGKAYPIAKVVWSLQEGQQLSKYEDREAHNLCSYGQADAHAYPVVSGNH